MYSDIKNFVNEADFTKIYNSNELNDALLLGKKLKKIYPAKKYAYELVQELFNVLGKKDILSFIAKVTEKCCWKKIILPSVFLNILQYNESTQYAIAYTIVLGIASEEEK